MSLKHFLLISFFIAVFPISLCAVFTGCGPSPYPEGFPKIYPCEITVTQEGTPLEGATVVALTEDSNLAKWPVGGITDASGKTSLTTMGKFKGAPAGVYTILVSKTETSGSLQASEDVSTQSVPKLVSYVDSIYNDVKQSPHKVTFEAKSNHFDIDAGKKVKITTTIQR